MSVTLTPLAPRYAVLDADDPFKKYWWAILLGIVFTALWLLAPMLGEKSVGSTVVETGQPKSDAGVEQTLASDADSGMNLAMGGTGQKKEEGSLRSGLYQAPAEEATAAATAGPAAPGSAAAGSAAGSTLAGALKKVSESSGGWGEKAQKGFHALKLAGSSLSGMGAASGGRSGSAASGTSAFGSSNAKIGFAGASGLSGGGSDVAAGPNSKGVAALKAAAAQAVSAAANTSNDAARSSLTQAFDGAKGGSAIGGGGASLPGHYAALDSAPVNLKLSDPKLNDKDKKREAPPKAANVGASDMKDSDMAKQIAMQLAATAIGGAIGGPVGGIVTDVIMKAVERQEAQARKVRELEEKQAQDRASQRMGLATGG